jgi:hypothetical protein
MFKKCELLRKTHYNFIKIDLNFPATLASPSFELATRVDKGAPLDLKSKLLAPQLRRLIQYSSFKLHIYTTKVVKNPKSLKVPGSLWGL